MVLIIWNSTKERRKMRTTVNYQEKEKGKREEKKR
jgi:hypothetical protein